MAFAAAAFASLRDGGSRAWDAAWLGALLLSLALAVLLAVHRRGPTRAFWLGFALFGGLYLLAIQSEPLRARLPTTRGLIELQRLYPEQVINLSALPVAERDAIVAEAEAEDSPADVVFGFDSGGRLFLTRGGIHEFFYPIGHSICAFLIAFAGALASRRLHRHEPSSRLVSPPDKIDVP